jgi:hypothetical protein
MKTSFVAIFVLLTACFEGPQFLKQRSPSEMLSVTLDTSDPDKAIGSITAGSTLTQVVNTTVPGVGGMTEVAFPPGSLTISTEIILQAGSDIATPATASSLNIDGFTDAGSAVVVSSSTPVDAVSPFVIRLPLPSTGLRLADDYETLVVVYKVQKVGDERIVQGVLPRSELLIENGQVSFATQFFGSFQVAYTAKAVDETTEVETTTPIQTKIEEKTLPPIKISGRKPFVVKTGQTVELTGLNFRPTMTLALNGVRIAQLNLRSDSSVSFVVPSQAAAGMLSLTATQDGVTQSVSLGYTGKNDKPVISLSADQVCKGIEYYNLDGVLKTGSRTCNYAQCDEDGETGCLTNDDFKAADTRTFSANKIVKNYKIAGISGTLEECNEDAEVGCVTTNGFKAADMTYAVPENIRTSVTIAGAVGNVVETTATACASDNDPNCVTSPDYPSVVRANIDYSAIRANETIAGSPGTLVDCSASVKTNCFATSSFPAEDPATISANAAFIHNSLNIAGVPGEMPDCTNNGQQDCRTTVSFQAADLTNLDAGNIKNGVEIAGVTGLYPSVGYELAGASGVADLESGSFNAKIKSATAFEYWNSVGVRQTGAGDADIIAGKIKSGTDIFGEMGSLPVSPCTYDGAQDCVVSEPYRAAAYNNITEFDVRKGKTIAGVQGSLKFCANGVSTGVSHDSDPSLTSDIWDTVGDSADGDLTGGVFAPLTSPGAVPLEMCDTEVWMDVTQDGDCTDSGDDCSYKDSITGLEWAEEYGSSNNFVALANHCQDVTFNGKSDWRIPTQKELLQAYVNGFARIKDPNFYSLAPVELAWSSTIPYGTGFETSKRYGVSMYHGHASSVLESATGNIVYCVRP